MSTNLPKWKYLVSSDDGMIFGSDDREEVEAARDDGCCVVEILADGSMGYLSDEGVLENVEKL